MTAEAPTMYTLAAKIASDELVTLAMLRRCKAPGIRALDVEEYRARCDDELDRALDVAVLAVWEHTDPLDAAAEFGEGDWLNDEAA